MRFTFQSSPRNFRGARLSQQEDTAGLLEASALQHASRLPALPGRSPLLRLQSDERLIALTRSGNQGAFETLVQRYQSRLLAFCRHMLGSTEDAEDVLQEVFAASYNAMLADERPINARPWLYRIARNRCLNHLRRPTAAGQDSMDVFERDGGTSTADTVHKREEFRQIVADVQELPRRSARRSCCARSTRCPTTRSPRRWTRRCPASSRSSCARACRWPRPPRRGCSAAARSGSSWAGGRAACPLDGAERLLAGVLLDEVEDLTDRAGIALRNGFVLVGHGHMCSTPRGQSSTDQRSVNRVGIAVLPRHRRAIDRSGRGAQADPAHTTRRTDRPGRTD